jgi:Uma2 family endonuclease
MATTEALLTAEEFLLLPDTGRPMELVRGRIVMMNVPYYRHGKICGRIVRIVGNFVEEGDLGTVISNDAGVITERGPDSVRGADVAYYSYQRVPKDADPDGYPEVAPEIVFEVRSPSDRSKPVQEKLAEYLNAGVLVVCVVEPADQSVDVHYPGRPVATLTIDQELVFPEILPGFSLPLQRLFK